jgi:hypothetical protein
MNFSDMWQTWLKATTSPSEATYLELRQRPEANVTTAILWIAIYAIFSSVIGLLGGLMAFNTMNTFMPQFMAQAGMSPGEAARFEQMMRMFTGGMGMGMVGFGSLLNLIIVPLFFLLGVAVYHLIAKVLGGVGEFGRYAYLNAAFSAPLGIISTVISLVPFGGCLTPFLFIYSLALVFFATKAEHRLSDGRALMVVLIPLLVLLALGICAVAFVLSALMSLRVQ